MDKQDNNVKTQVTNLRSEIQAVSNSVLVSKEAYKTSPNLTEQEDRGEVIANLTLAQGHLEDAKMRLGKVIQAVDGISGSDTSAI